jgi:hypothetical protein
MSTKAKIIRALGALLLLASVALAFFWFIWLLPLKHIYSRAWDREYSTVRFWEEAQKTVYRIGITHDVGIEMGRWGGKEWVVWIMKHIKPGEEIVGCEASHLAGALADMTNQQLGYQADPWLAWWRTNQNKTQLEWIRDGFASKGIILQQPLTTNNILALLKLSHLATNSPVFTNTPPNLRTSLRFNAFRWLRDSGFRSIEFDLKNIPEEDRNQITLALIDYAEWSGIHRDDPGKLPINEYSLGYPSSDACFLTPRFRWPLYLTIIAMALGGWYLLRVSHKNMRS